VAQAQRLLNNNPFGDFLIGRITGLVGTDFFAEVKEAKRTLGYPVKAIVPLFGQDLRDLLSGDRPLPPDFEERQQARAARAAQETAIRDQMVAVCEWAIDHEPDIHYSKERPVAIETPFETIPPGGLQVDCSGSTELFAKWAGAPDPSGLGYSGFGFSGTMASHLRMIPQSLLRLGDIVIFGVPDTHHVAVVIELGDDPVLQSHGEEAGPIRISLSREADFHADQGGFRCYSLL
jgi:hypothetical protein